MVAYVMYKQVGMIVMGCRVCRHFESTCRNMLVKIDQFITLHYVVVHMLMFIIQ